MFRVRLREKQIIQDATLCFNCEFWDTLSYKVPNLKVVLRVSEKGNIQFGDVEMNQIYLLCKHFGKDKRTLEVQPFLQH